MSRYLCYLSGPIAGLTFEEGSDWREYVSRCFPPHITGVSPLRGHQMLKGAGPITKGTIDHPMRTDRAINKRDRVDVLRSNIMLVNLLGATKVTIGTVMEIAWAHDHNIPIIAAMEPEGNIHDHAMIRDAIDVHVYSLEEAVEVVTAWVSPEQKLIWNRINQAQMERRISPHVFDIEKPFETDDADVH